MTKHDIEGKRVAILATDGFEQSELFEPKKALDEAGAKTEVVALKGGSIKAWNKKDWGKAVKVDRVVDDANPAEYDALLLPGGVMSPDHLRINSRAVHFVRSFFEDGKPVAAICHGPWTMVEADVVRGRRLTSYPSIKTDLRNAGADWVDETVVVDSGLVTSRNPDDLPAFIDKMLEEFAEGPHEGQRASGSAAKVVGRGVD
jgi:protease I